MGTFPSQYYRITGLVPADIAEAVRAALPENNLAGKVTELDTGELLATWSVSPADFKATLHRLRAAGLRKLSFELSAVRIMASVPKGVAADVGQDIASSLRCPAVNRLRDILSEGEIFDFNGPPDEGEIFYYGERVFTYDDEKLAAFRNRTIGFVFQFHHLLPEFNALENTMMPALINGMNRKEASERAEAILTRVGLGHRLGHHVGELSGGEHQRVAVARSLIMKPSILLADEPTGNLDTRTGDSIHDLLISLNREDGITAVVVTHNMKLAEKLTRRVTLVDGKALAIN